MSVVEKPPVPLQSQLLKVWAFVQNSDGTFSPAPASGGGSAGNVNITGINGSAPALSNPLAVELSDGTNAFGTAGNPLSVNVITGGGSNASVGATGSAVPASATYDGINVAGTMRGATGVNPSGSIFAQQVDLASILGVTIVAAAAGVQKVGISGAAGATLDGTAGSPSAGVLTVQGVSGGQTLPVTATIAAAQTIAVTNAGTFAVQASIAAAQTIAVTNAGTFAVQAAQNGNWTSRVVGNVGGVLDGVLGAAKPANALQVGGNDGTNIFALPLASGGGSLVVSGSVAASGTVTANQGTAAALTAGWPVVTGQTAESTAAWTSGTAGNTAVTLTVQGLNTVVVALNQGSTITGGVVTFEVSDTTGFTNAYPVFGMGMNAANVGFPANIAVAGSYTLAANVNESFTFNVAGWAAFRVRLSTVISGSGTINVGVAASAAPSTPLTLPVGTSALTPTQTLVTVVSGVAASDGVSATQFSASGGGGRVGQVLDTVCTGPPGTAANNVVVRTPNIFKSASVPATASGNTAVWTPTTGKKFRLMRFQVQGVNLVATAATVITVQFQDSTTNMNIGVYDVLLPASATATGILVGGVQFNSDWVDIGNGFLSAAANNVLNYNVSATVTGATGSFRVNVCGTEE